MLNYNLELSFLNFVFYIYLYIMAETWKVETAIFLILLRLYLLKTFLIWTTVAQCPYSNMFKKLWNLACSKSVKLEHQHLRDCAGQRYFASIYELASGSNLDCFKSLQNAKCLQFWMQGCRYIDWMYVWCIGVKRYFTFNIGCSIQRLIDRCVTHLHTCIQVCDTSTPVYTFTPVYRPVYKCECVTHLYTGVWHIHACIQVCDTFTLVYRCVTHSHLYTGDTSTPVYRCVTHSHLYTGDTSTPVYRCVTHSQLCTGVWHIHIYIHVCDTSTPI